MASSVMEKQSLTGRLKEQLVRRDKGEHNLMTLSGTGRQKKKHVLECNWQEIKKVETEDELKTRRPSEMVKRWSLVREV